MSDLTPADIEKKMFYLVKELDAATKELADCRDVEVEAKHTFEKSRRSALLSEDRPRVERGGLTTAERDAWVDDKAAYHHDLFEIAEARRKAAQDRVQTLRDQSMLVMALGKSISTAYNMAGVS